jgi:hypothetical protein
MYREIAERYSSAFELLDGERFGEKRTHDSHDQKELSRALQGLDDHVTHCEECSEPAGGHSRALTG